MLVRHTRHRRRKTLTMCRAENGGAMVSEPKLELDRPRNPKLEITLRQFHSSLPLVAPSGGRACMSEFEIELQLGRCLSSASSDNRAPRVNHAARWSGHTAC